MEIEDVMMRNQDLVMKAKLYEDNLRSVADLLRDTAKGLKTAWPQRASALWVSADLIDRDLKNEARQTPIPIRWLEQTDGECFLVWDGTGWTVAVWLDDKNGWFVEGRQIRPTHALPLPPEVQDDDR